MSLILSRTSNSHSIKRPMRITETGFLGSAARVDLHDMPIRVQHIDLREASRPVALHQEPPPAPLRGVLGVAMPDQVIERGVEVLHPQGEVAVIIVNLRVGPEGGFGVNYEMH